VIPIPGRGGVVAIALLGLLPLAACVPGPPPPASQYHRAATLSRLDVVFVPGGTQVTEPESAQLRSIGLGLPVQAVAALHASGPLAPARTAAVARSLGRPVQLVNAPGMPPDQATLVFESPAIVADACRGPGVRMLGSIWPSNDDVAPVLLPPGCAVAADIQTQVVQPDDLLVGRPLPPGAATPFAAAIERYYHRNDPPQSNAAQGGSSGSGDQSGSGAAQGSETGSAANPLLGPLPAGGPAGN
jgi:hypothetical protein